MRKVVALGALLGLFFFCSTAAQASFDINFGDTSKFFPGYANNTPDDGKDVIGVPDFTGGTATFSSGQLTKVSFSITSPTAPTSPGDLFIGIGSSWYFVDLTTWTIPGSHNPVALAGNYNIYSININEANGFTLSGQDNVGGWAGYEIRDKSPVAWKGSTISDVGDVYFSGWNTTSYFDFGGVLSYSPGDTITIAWSPNCANDVLYETIKTPVPEPSILVLLGSGLLAIAAVRKRFTKV